MQVCNCNLFASYIGIIYGIGFYSFLDVVMCLFYKDAIIINDYLRLIIGSTLFSCHYRNFISTYKKWFAEDEHKVQFSWKMSPDRFFYMAIVYPYYCVLNAELIFYCSNIYSPMIYERLLFIGPVGVFLTVCLECAELFHSLRIYIIQYHYYTNTALVT